MVGNMSFYKCPNFGAVMIRFSIFFKIQRKSNFPIGILSPNDLPPLSTSHTTSKFFEHYGDVFPFSTYGSIGLISGFFVDFPHRDGAVPLSEIGKLIF